MDETEGCLYKYKVWASAAREVRDATTVAKGATAITN